MEEAAPGEKRGLHMEPIALFASSKVHILIAFPDYVDPDIFYAVIRIFLSG